MFVLKVFSPSLFFMRPRRFKQLYMCIAILSIYCNAYSQSSTNYLQLTVHSMLNFSCSSASDFENDKTISSAFSLKVKTNSKSCHVYVKLSSWTHPSGFTPSSCPVEVDYTSDNSPNATISATGPLQLTTSDQLLFTQPKTSGPSTAYTFNYNCVLQSLGYEYVPGTYGYTLLFTMSQP